MAFMQGFDFKYSQYDKQISMRLGKIRRILRMIICYWKDTGNQRLAITKKPEGA